MQNLGLFVQADRLGKSVSDPENASRRGLVHPEPQNGNMYQSGNYKR